MSSFLALSAEVNREGEAQVRACLLDRFDGAHRLAGWIGPADLPPTEPRAEDEADLPQAMRTAIRTLGERLGRPLWDTARSQPLIESDDPVRREPVDQVIALATPLPRLRVWLAGLTQFGLDGMAEAVNGSLAQVVGQTRLSRESHPTQILGMISDHQPQVLVISGGMDSPLASAQEPVLALCNLIGQGLAQVPPAQRPALLYAGNAAARPQAEALLRQCGGALRLMSVANVQPAPGLFRQAPVIQILHRLYGALAERLPAMSRLAQWTASAAPIEGVDWGFARLLRLWAEYRDLPDLHGLYCGDEWWLHGWVERPQSGRARPGGPATTGANAPIRLIFTQPGTRPPAVTGWPPLDLVCGAWPDSLWPKPPAAWHDVRRLAPAIAALGQIDPQAALQVLGRDILQGQL